MGWKGTKCLTRAEAIDMLYERLDDLRSVTNEELARTLEGFGYGDNEELKYYGNNFTVFDDNEEEDELL